MKKFINISSLLVFVLLALVSCEEYEWNESDLAEVPVYALTNIEGEMALHAIEVYPQQSLTIEFEKASALKSFAITDYQDVSTASDYDISYMLTKGEGEAIVFYEYVYTGTKEDSAGVYTIYDASETEKVQIATGTMKIFPDTRLY
ncbi:hypothetical protein [Labilibacter marinus]|uniref:hypothetical protein n=1 Tax=Labilibacter marinus TaxID=1477105 RepID=UPI00082CBF67|nr:hypothetical protein [Labilibacter marinus]